MKIGLVQYSPNWENPDASIVKVNKMIESTDLIDVSLLIFPEMSLTGFTMNSNEFAEELDGISYRYFMNLSKRIKKHIFAGIIERDGKNIYNSLIHFDDMGVVRIIYRKIHPFSYAKEDKNYNAGSKPITTKINDFIFGLSICYDLRFPELYRLYAKQKVDVLVNIANWPDTRIDHWDKLLQARAIENQCYMIGINRVGEDKHLRYPGHSSAINPMGDVIGSCMEEKIEIVQIDKDEIFSIRENLPFLDDIKLIR